MLTGVSLQILRDTIKQENGESVGFSLMALTKVGNDAENECFGELSIAADCKEMQKMHLMFPKFPKFPRFYKFPTYHPLRSPRHSAPCMH